MTNFLFALFTVAGAGLIIAAAVMVFLPFGLFVAGMVALILADIGRRT